MLTKTMSPLFAIVGLAGIATAAVPAPGVATSADATYEGVGPGLDMDSTTGSASGPAISVESRSYEPVFGDIAAGTDVEGIAFDDADARARAALPGTIGAYARAGGFSPGHGTTDGAFATATTRVTTNWTVNGPTGGQTPIDVAAFYDGFLYVSSNSSPPPVSAGEIVASVNVEMNYVTDAGATSVFAAGGTLKLNAAGNPSNQNLTTTFNTLDGAPATEWENSWTQQSIYINGVDVFFELDYVETFDDLFMVDNNELWAFESVISVTADNQVGVFEIFATSDFFNSGDVDLSVDTPGVTLVGLNPIPEPATGLLVAAALLLGRRR